MAEEETAAERGSAQNVDDASLKEQAAKREKQRQRKKKRLLEEAHKAEKRGVCYLSRVPPHMDPLKLRQILSQYAEIGRIFLTPEGQRHAVLWKKKKKI